ncbi:hypothetical protein NVP1161O_225 [Vibrio phage 1.161.O._10N.261.48.C5]|nr:hypothetical protein NVP1161O_225 [Vibrio phage 1.161.O._10N.261.48.C5]
MNKFIEACKSEDPMTALKEVAREYYDNDTDYVITGELSTICDKHGLITNEEITNNFYKPLTWDEYEGRDFKKVLLNLYIEKIRWTKSSVFTEGKGGEQS